MSNKYFRLSSFGFYLLSLLLCFILGLYAAKISGAAEGQMLAGGAIVLMWGLMFAIVGLFIAIVVLSYTSRKIIVRINWILLVLLAGLFAYGYFQLSEKTHDPNPEKPPSLEPTAPEPNAALIAFTKPSADLTTVMTSDDMVSSSLGVGYFKPDLAGYPTLYFYAGLGNLTALEASTPTDSIVFAEDAFGNPTSTYAPPWLYPEHLKLDYGILIFKVLGIGRTSIEVEANRQTGQRIFLDKSKGKYMSWPEFLLSVNSVEFTDGKGGRIHIKPVENSQELKLDYEFLQPLMVKSDWMYVALVDSNFEEQGKGWIRWKKANQLLITYSLLS